MGKDRFQVVVLMVSSRITNNNQLNLQLQDIKNLEDSQTQLLINTWKMIVDSVVEASIFTELNKYTETGNKHHKQCG